MLIKQVLEMILWLPQTIDIVALGSVHCLHNTATVHIDGLLDVGLVVDVEHQIDFRIALLCQTECARIVAVHHFAL